MDSPSLVASAVTTSRATGRAQTVGYFVSFLALGMVATSLGPTVLSLAAQTRTEIGSLGWLFAARSSGYLLGSFLSGPVYDRVRGHPVFAISLMSMAALMAVAPLMPLLWMLLAVLLLIGLVEGFIDVGGNTLIVWLHRDKVGPLMNGLHFCFSFGAFLAPIIIAQVIAQGAWYGWAYWIISLALLPIAVAFTRLHSPVAPVASADAGAQRVNWLLVALLSLFFLLYVAAEVSFTGWISTYAVELHLYTIDQAAYLVSAFWGAIMVGRLVGMPLASRLRPRAILLADLLVCIGSVSCIVVWPQSYVALWAGTVGLGLGMASIFPTALAFAQRRMALSGKITSLFLVGSSLGSITLPWLVGQLFERHGPGVTMLLVLLALVAECGVFAVLVRTPSATAPTTSAH